MYFNPVIAFSVFFLIVFVMIMFSSKRKASRERIEMQTKIGDLTEYLVVRGIIESLGGEVLINKTDLVQISTVIKGMNTVFTVSVLPRGIVIHVLFHMATESKLVEQVRDCDLFLRDVSVQDFIDLAVKSGEKHKEIYPEEWV